LEVLARQPPVGGLVGPILLTWTRAVNQSAAETGFRTAPNAAHLRNMLCSIFLASLGRRLDHQFNLLFLLDN